MALILKRLKPTTKIRIAEINQMTVCRIGAATIGWSPGMRLVRLQIRSGECSYNTVHSLTALPSLCRRIELLLCHHG